MDLLKALLMGAITGQGPGPSPSGTISISANGSYDVAQYAEAEVNVAGGGSNVVASGTFVGDGGMVAAVNVGKRMPKTNFLFRASVAPETDFDTSATYKIVHSFVVVFQPDYFDLSTDGTHSITKQFKISIDSVAYDAPTTISVNVIARNANLVQQVIQSNLGFYTVIKSEDGFVFTDKTVSPNFDTGKTYYWELIYFGNDPDNDIVEVP